MKKFIIFLILFSVFLFIFIKSETLEIRHVAEDKTKKRYKIGESYSSEYIFHWDRFFEYIKDIPRKIFK